MLMNEGVSALFAQARVGRSDLGFFIARWKRDPTRQTRKIFELFEKPFLVLTYRKDRCAVLPLLSIIYCNNVKSNFFFGSSLHARKRKKDLVGVLDY